MSLEEGHSGVRCDICQRTVKHDDMQGWVRELCGAPRQSALDIRHGPDYCDRCVAAVLYAAEETIKMRRLDPPAPV